jgi:hypothetical protein
VNDAWLLIGPENSQRSYLFKAKALGEVLIHCDLNHNQTSTIKINIG